MCTQQLVTYSCGCQRPYGPLEWCSLADFWRLPCAGDMLVTRHAHSRELPVLCHKCGERELLNCKTKPPRKPLRQCLKPLLHELKSKVQRLIHKIHHRDHGNKTPQADSDQRVFWIYDVEDERLIPVRNLKVLKPRTRSQRFWTGTMSYLRVR